MFYRCELGLGQGGGDEIGPTKRGKVAKIMAIVDRHGLHLAVSTHPANHHAVTLVQPSFDFCMIEARPGNLNCDRANDSDKLDDELWQEGIEIISLHSRNRTKNQRRRMAVDCLATSGAGWQNASLPGFSGNVVSWFGGNITPGTSPALCSSQPSLSC
jgi:hypothetical protein